MVMPARPLAVRHREKYEQGPGCWLWTGHISQGGYGTISSGTPLRKTLIAHRVAYELHIGPIPEGQNVLHDCDRNYKPGDITYRRCVRPDHLFLGTGADNMADRDAKGRGATGDRSGSRLHPERLARGDRHGLRVHPERRARGERNGTHTHPEKVRRGEDHGRAIITSQIARAIREEYAAGSISMPALARKYGYRSHGAISDILYGRKWKEAGGPIQIPKR